MYYEFSAPGRIIIGRDSIKEVSSLIPANVKLAFVITGKTSERAEPLLKQLNKSGIEYSVFNLEGEPTVYDITNCTDEARKNNPDIIFGVGGGSVIDAGKAVSVLLTNTGSLLDYLEVIGKGKQIVKEPIPYIAVLTTAGTGSEVTKNAVIGSPEHKVKVSMRDVKMIPQSAILDPCLTVSMPNSITASTGMDALSHLIEAFVSNKANGITDGLCREGIRKIGKSFKKLINAGSDLTAREDMQTASLLGGYVLSNSKLGAVHGFAEPLGGMFSAPHGALCARLLAPVMKANISSLKKEEPDSPVLNKYKEISRILTGNNNAAELDSINWIEEICGLWNIPEISEYGILEKDFNDIISKAKNSSSMKGNPIKLEDNELLTILERAV